MRISLQSKRLKIAHRLKCSMIPAQIWRLVKTVAVWIRLNGPGLQYWGKNCLSALVSTIGKPVMIDKVTQNRSMVKFARVLVDMDISDEPPKLIEFLNERKQLVEQQVEYEWLPSKCGVCGMLGHIVSNCNKDKRVAWKKRVNGEKKAVSDEVEDDVQTRQGSKLVTAVVEVQEGKGDQIDKAQKGDEEKTKAAGVAMMPRMGKENDWITLKRTGGKPSFVIQSKEQEANLRNGYDVLQMDGAWNVRGMNKKEKQHAILEVWRENKIGVAALFETKIKHEKNKYVTVSILAESQQMVHCRIKVCGKNKAFFATVVDGSNSLVERKELWKQLADVGIVSDPWIILGDFNSAFSYQDRIGGKLHNGYKETVLAKWNTNQGSLSDIVKNLLRVTHALKKFNKDVVGDIVVDYNLAKHEFYKAQEALAFQPSDRRLQEEEKCCPNNLLQLQPSYFSHLKQQSKITWIQCNDENSSYFHASMRKRRIENRITTFTIGDKVEDDYPKVIDHFVTHFKSFMGRRSTATSEIDPDSLVYGNKLSLEQQIRLIAPFLKSDVKRALFGIHSLKSPGLDGFGSEFFKHLWPEIGDDITRAVLGFFQTGWLPSDLNEMVISLIPKGAFIKNRLLAHNILIFQDLLKGYTRKNISARCIMKIDLSKVYDTVDWHFIESLLKQLCFPSKFIQWIMVCLKGTRYNLLFNGKIQGSFKGEKGLWQGDPMSRLLFVLVMDYLTRLLAHASTKKGFGFHPLCKQSNLINLCFADDLLIFCRGNIKAVKVVSIAFRSFCEATGLAANNSKSHIYFGGVKEIDKKKILEEVQMEEGSFPLKYLGVKLRPTKWKAPDCGIILDKLNKNLNCWASINLSFAGRAQLIHSVLLGIRNFWMSLFILPQKVTAAIDKSCRDFLWGIKGNRSKLHLSSWEKVCLPKNLEGLGFREGRKWNEALIAKFLWAVSSKQHNLWVRWIHAIYMKDNNLWTMPIKNDTSWYFEKLLRLRHRTNEQSLQQAVKKGKFRAKLFYSNLRTVPRVDYARNVWHRLIMPKHRFIYWQVCNNHLLTRDNLRKLMSIDSSLCPVCESEIETHNHLFVDCLYTKRLAAATNSWFGNFQWPKDISELQKGTPKAAFNLRNQLQNAVLAAVLYFVWWNRNHCVFESKCMAVGSVSLMIKQIIKYRILCFTDRSNNKAGHYVRTTTESW
uniref:Reverse transcriptase domain-containing protein n=1 Tax=Cannabis sativa TaxID=3483 RepID=A0A803P4Q1_CANSA